jgi:ATP-dependent RNA helicase SUPV3L1/SUV3
MGIRSGKNEVRVIQKALAGREITSDLVIDEVKRQDAVRQDQNRDKWRMKRFNEAARGEYRIVDGMWQARVHVNVGRTGIVFWIDVDEVRSADRQVLTAETQDTSGVRGLAQRLRSGAPLVAEPIRRRCEELDAVASQAGDDDELVFVKTAMRQLVLETTVPNAIIAIIEAAHKRALARTLAVARLAADPHEIGDIVALDGEEHAPRRIIALVGPTNSGKTHAALEMLREAETGVYLGPLRLMAMENHDRLKGFGLKASMRTGEESIIVEGATHSSATVEMADVDVHSQVVVVDESQLLDDPQRGWAWTRAIFHQKCDTLVVTGSQDCIPILRRIAFLTGEQIEVRTFQRRAPLSAMSEMIDLRDLRAGDAVIAFARNNVLALKGEISRIENPKTGKPFRVAMIYGTLGPEVRRSEAARFSSGDAEILVATDAIGMGLNLPIDRVLFSSMTKYDGTSVRDVSDSEIRQIGGRAGRHGQSEGGWVGALRGAGQTTRPIAIALASQPSTKGMDPRPYIFPTIGQIERGMDALEVDLLSKALPAVSGVLRDGPDYRCQVGADIIDLLQTIEQFDIPLRDKHAWIGCPIPLRDQDNRRVVEEWASLQQHGLPIRLTPLEYEIGSEVDDHRLQEIERTVAQAGAYLWLSRRWPRTFSDIEIASSVRHNGNRMIEDALRQRHIHRKCQECGTPIGFRVHHKTCRKCAFG